jgi:peptidyl-dipeptidase Dcp
MLSDVTFSSLSGTNVYWDFVELPSQFMENFALEKEFLHTFARHYKTGKMIPDEYIKRIIDSKNFEIATRCLGQVAYGLIDMNWHTQREAFNGDVIETEREAKQKVMIGRRSNKIPTCISTHFSHIFCGGYAAGYYSYKWAEVLDADAFSLFKKNGIFNKATAQSFRDNILSKGGTEPPIDLYKRFRGQEPTIDALLIRDGIKKN